MDQSTMGPTATPVPGRFYIVTRADLPPGLLAAQVAHAAFEFSHQHRELADRWLTASNNLVVVAVPDEPALHAMAAAATIPGLRRTLVVEPDLGGQATALALEPDTASQRLCSNLPLALRQEPTMDP